LAQGLPVPKQLELIAVNRIDSTNEELKRRAATGAAAGTVIWAEEQLAGRGRRGRTWVSPPGNLYCSMLLRPTCPAREAMQIGFVTALAVAEVLEGILPASIAVTCKWPNDVLAGGRKVAGILLESSASGGEGLEWLVIGVGVNVVSYPPQTDGPYPATSLLALGSGNPKAEELLEAYCACLFRWLRVWAGTGFEPIRAAWLRRAHGLRQPVRVRLDNQTLDGIFVTMDETGALVLDQNGASRLITAGDVFPAGG
jgi:BirA family biotin operon repressor/biotin-[acetyl-CoA-carboxylase] ligase